LPHPPKKKKWGGGSGKGGVFGEKPWGFFVGTRATISTRPLPSKKKGPQIHKGEPFGLKRKPGFWGREWKKPTRVPKLAEVWLFKNQSPTDQKKGLKNMRAHGEIKGKKIFPGQETPFATPEKWKRQQGCEGRGSERAPTKGTKTPKKQRIPKTKEENNRTLFFLGGVGVHGPGPGAQNQMQKRNQKKKRGARGVFFLKKKRKP